MNYRNIRARARESLRGNWGVSVGAGFVAAIFGASIGGVNSFSISQSALESLPPGIAAIIALVFSIVSVIAFAQLILSGVVQLGYAKFLLARQDGKEYAIKDLFSQFNRFTVGFLQMFLRTLFTFLWALLLIVPGIVKSLSYAMTPFILADHPELTAKQAIRRSMELMDGHKEDLFCLNLSFLGWQLLCLLTLGIGLLWLNPYIEAAYAAFYREITAEKHETYVEL